MNQVAVINSARYIKLFFVSIFIVALAATLLAFGGVKLPTKAKPTTCGDVVFLHRVGGWDIATNPNGQTVKLSAVEAWNETSSNARRSLAVSCAK